MEKLFYLKYNRQIGSLLNRSIPKGKRSGTILYTSKQRDDPDCSKILELSQKIIEKTREKELKYQIEEKSQASSVTTRPEHKDLDDFLPDDKMVRLQQLSGELGLKSYPKTGILDLYYALHTQQRSLLDELKVREGEEWQRVFVSIILLLQRLSTIEGYGIPFLRKCFLKYHIQGKNVYMRKNLEIIKFD